jgi:CRP-like cAMP-binding protein
MGYLGNGARTASIVAINEVRVIGVSAALMAQASCGLQVKLMRAFLTALTGRLTRASEALAKG